MNCEQQLKTATSRVCFCLKLKEATGESNFQSGPTLFEVLPSALRGNNRESALAFVCVRTHLEERQICLQKVKMEEGADERMKLFRAVGVAWRRRGRPDGGQRSQPPHRESRNPRNTKRQTLARDATAELAPPGNAAV